MRRGEERRAARASDGRERQLAGCARVRLCRLSPPLLLFFSVGARARIMLMLAGFGSRRAPPRAWTSSVELSRTGSVRKDGAGAGAGAAAGPHTRALAPVRPAASRGAWSTCA